MVNQYRKCKLSKNGEKAGKEESQLGAILCTTLQMRRSMEKNLYNWYAVNDPRGLAPNGWHVPTEEQWSTLEEFLGVDANKSLK